MVIKNVDNGNGGTSTPADFMMNVSGATTTSFAGSASGVNLLLNLVGTTSYSVWESIFSGNYASSSSADCNGSIAPGETKTCTITNTYVPPEPTTGVLTIVKQIVGSIMSPESVHISVRYPNDQIVQTQMGSASGVNYTLAGGDYLITEDEQWNDGWSAAFSGSCVASSTLPGIGQVTVTNGATSTCTIVNTYTAPSD